MSKQHEDSKQALIEYMEGQEPFVLNSWIIRQISKLIFRTDDPSLLISFLVMLIIFAVFYGVATVSQLIVDPGAYKISLVFIILCLMGASSLFIIHAAHQTGFSPIARNLTPILVSSNEAQAIHEWLDEILSPGWQIAVSLAWGVFCFFLAYLFFPSFVLDGQSSISFAIIGFLSQFSTANGWYWGFIFPQLWRRVGNVEVDLNWLDPSSTPEYRRLARVANSYTGYVSIIATGYLIWLLIVLKPFTAQTSTVVSTGLTSLILLLLIYTFIAPHTYMAETIRKEKGETIQDIEKMIQGIRREGKFLSSEQVELVSKLDNLQKRVMSSPSTMIDIGSIRSFITSIIPPIASYFAGGFNLEALIDFFSN